MSENQTLPLPLTTFLKAAPWAGYTAFFTAALAVQGDLAFAFLLTTWGLTFNNVLKTFRPQGQGLPRTPSGAAAATLLTAFALIALCPAFALATGGLALSEKLQNQ